MHAPVLKRTPLSHVVGLALVLGLAASLALNGTLLLRSDEPAAPVAATQADAALLARQRFVGAKMARIEAMEAAIGAAYIAPTQVIYSDRFFEVKLGQLEQMSAGQSSQSSATPGLIDVDQYQADQNAARADTSSSAEQMDRADYHTWQRSQPSSASGAGDPTSK